MELTTVQDNQTTASIDLYRSESGTMEDAEYVDTLELSELVPHPGGETSISFTIQLHEDNTLSAEVVDSESGKTSATKSDLVNLPAEKKRSSMDEFPADVSDVDFEEPPLPEAPVNGPVEDLEEEFAQDDFPQPAVEGSAGIADFELPDFDLDDFSSVDSLPSIPAQEDAASEDSLPAFEDISPEESEAVSAPPATVDDLPGFGDVSLDLGDGSSEEAPAFDLDSLDLDDFASVDSAMDEVSEGGDGSNALLAAGVGAVALGRGAAAVVASNKDDEDDSHLDALFGKDDTVADSGLDATSFDLPDFDFGNSRDDSGSSHQDTSVYEDSLPDFSKFELPDFDEPVRNDFSFGEESGLFNENDFKDPAFYTDDTAASSASPLDFSGLYDDRENELIQQENRRKRGGISVAVCVICALICVGILLFILFLLPSKLSDSRNAGNQVSVLDSHTVTVSQQEMEAQPDSTAAVEDVIVIVETPAVVPAPPPQVAKTPEVVRYEVKWGDTLWDIAQSYYNNPWLYKRIATANNIKNPDHIVAGIILTIPPQ